MSVLGHLPAVDAVWRTVREEPHPEQQRFILRARLLNFPWPQPLSSERRRVGRKSSVEWYTEASYNAVEHRRCRDTYRRRPRSMPQKVVGSWCHRKVLQPSSARAFLNALPLSKSHVSMTEANAVHDSLSLREFFTMCQDNFGELMTADHKSSR